MKQSRGDLAKTRTYLYLIFVCEFLSLFTRPIHNLTGFGLRKIVFGFIALILMQLIMVIMYNLKFTADIASMRKVPKKGGKNKGPKKQEDKIEEMLNCAARIRVFMIVTAVILIIQALAFQFIGEAIFEILLIVTEITCLVLSLQNLTTLQRMI